MQNTVKRQRISVIKDRTFKTLWDHAQKCESEKQFISSYTDPMSKMHTNFKAKYGIEYSEAVMMLKEIYEKSKMTMADIMGKAGVRKSDISNTFCIPYRTVEAWEKGINPCPPYIRLMFLRYYYLIKLGRWISLESETKREKMKPRVYKKREHPKAKSSTPVRDPINKEEEYSDTKEETMESQIKDDIIDDDDLAFYENLDKITNHKTKQYNIEENRPYEAGKTSHAYEMSWKELDDWKAGYEEREKERRAKDKPKKERVVVRNYSEMMEYLKNHESS